LRILHCYNNATSGSRNYTTVLYLYGAGSRYVGLSSTSDCTKLENNLFRANNPAYQRPDHL